MDPSLVNPIQDVIVPLIPATIAAFADAAFGYAFQKRYRTWERDKDEQEARQAFEMAVENAYNRFAGKYPELAESFFDQDFLEESAASSIVATCLSRSGPPQGNVLAAAYADYLNRHGADRDSLIEEVGPAAQSFLSSLMQELGQSPIFTQDLDSQAIEKMAQNLEHIKASVHAIAGHTAPTVDPAVLANEIVQANAILRTHRTEILGRHITRPDAGSMVEWVLRADSEQKLGVLLDQPGAGKTGVMCDVLRDLESRHVPVLALKADAERFSGVTTADELADVLQISATVEETARYFIGAKGSFVLLIDQIDALSSALTRDPRALNVILDTVAHLMEVRGIRILLSCRTFDLHNDRKLAALKVNREFTIQPLPDEEIDNILRHAGVDPARLLGAHRTLLKVPLHLHIYTKLVAVENTEPLVKADPYYSLQELYEALWHEYIEVPRAPDLAHTTATERPAQAIDQMVDVMSVQRSVFVANATLDNFPLSRNYLLACGIIRAEGRNLGFLHQTFFDYAYARRFIGKGCKLFETVHDGPQGLFERSMIVQVLAYLRGTDPTSYISELGKLLRGDGIRFHIRDMIRGWLGALPYVLEEELNLVRMLVGDPSELSVLFEGMRGNAEWFQKLNASGVLSEKLRSRDEQSIDSTIQYLGSVINKSTTGVLDLLAPFAGADDKWNRRLLSCLQQLADWNNEGAITLLVHTVLCMGPESGLSMRFDTLAESNPAGGCRVVRAYLDVWLQQELQAYAREAAEAAESERAGMMPVPLRLRAIFGFGNASSVPYGMADLVRKAARHMPRALLDELLPWLIDAVTHTAQGSVPGDYYSTDRLFSGRWAEVGDENEDSFDVLPGAVSTALATLAAQDYEAFRSYSAQIEGIDNETLQIVLAQAHLSDPERHARVIADYLLSDARRFRLDSGTALEYVSHQLFVAALKYADAQTRKALEEAVHNIEKKGTAPKTQGYTELGFLMSAPFELLTPEARIRLQELQRRFPDYRLQTPHNLVFGTVVSPIPTKALNKMTDQQWLAAIHKYDDSTERHRNSRLPLAGGISQLSGVFVGEVEKDPHRFFSLSLRFDKAVSQRYIAALLSGLGSENTPPELLFAAVRRFAPELPTGYRATVCQSIKNMAQRGVAVPDDVLSLLQEWAEKDPDPAEVHPADPFNKAINSNRGIALDALCTALLKSRSADTEDTERVFQILERAARDLSGAVRAMAVEWLLEEHLVACDYERTLRIFMSACEGYPELAGTHGGYEVVRIGCRDHFTQMRPYIDMMLNSSTDDTREAGAALACAMAFWHPEAQTLAAQALEGDTQHRQGAARAYAEFAREPKHWSTCEARLRQLMNDGDRLVQAAVGGCWLFIPPAQVESVRQFILDFARSPSLPEGAIHLASYLDSIAEYEQDLALQVTDMVLEAVAKEREKAQGNTARFDTPLARVIVGDDLVRVPLTVYRHGVDDKIRRAAMDTFDKLLMLGSYRARRALLESDRQ